MHTTLGAETPQLSDDESVWSIPRARFVETDMRPQGAVQAYGMACSVSHLRAMREAECRYGDKPVIIFEDDQAFLPNARTYLPQICLHLMKSNLWRGRMLMYLGRGQHSSQINQRVHALSVFQRLGAITLRRLQVGERSVPRHLPRHGSSSCSAHLLFQEQVIRTAGLEDGRRSVSGVPNSVRPFARVLQGAKATPKVMLKQLLRASALPGSCDALCRGGGHSLQGRRILSVRYEECRATVRE